MCYDFQREFLFLRPGCCFLPQTSWLVYRFTLQPFLWIYYGNISSSNQEKLNPKFEMSFFVVSWNSLIGPFVASLVIVMATQLIYICGYSCLEIRALAFELPCRPSERSKIIHGWLEKTSYSHSSLCCQCYWWWCWWCEINKPVFVAHI